MSRKITKVSFGVIALSCIAFFIIGITQADANYRGFPNKGPCTMVGTWQGENLQGGAWFTVYTPGQNAFNGQVTGEFIQIDPTFFGSFPNTVRVTNPVGVWKKVGWRRYQYTTRAFGLDEYGDVVYIWRISGESELVDCDHCETTTSVIELWYGEDVDISTDISIVPPNLCVPGGFTYETRIPLVQASCE